MANPDPEIRPEEADGPRRGHRHRAQRLPEPDQQRARLPRHLPRRARRRRHHDHRGHEAGGGRGHRRGRCPPTSCGPTTSCRRCSTPGWPTRGRGRRRGGRGRRRLPSASLRRSRAESTGGGHVRLLEHAHPRGQPGSRPPRRRVAGPARRARASRWNAIAVGEAFSRLVADVSGALEGQPGLRRAGRGRRRARPPRARIRRRNCTTRWSR